MKFSINTARLNSALSKIHKGVGGSNIMPITEYLNIKLFDNVLSITATDLNNFITFTAKDVEGEEGEVNVKADALIKLVAKTTKSDMTFNSTETHLEVKGNGNYKIPLLAESFPTYEFNHDSEQIEISTANLKKALKVNSGSIAREMIMPCLTGYNIGETVITTDGIKMCINQTDEFLKDSRVLISQKLADLLHTLVDEKVIVQQDGNKLLFTTEQLVIFGSQLDGIEEYPDITGITELTYLGSCKVSKQDLLFALDRLSIFVDPFDNNGVSILFGDESLVISDLKGNSTEEVAMIQNDVLGLETKIAVNLQYFKDLLSVLTEPEVVLEFGNDLPLKIVEGEVVQILSIMSTEE